MSKLMMVLVMWFAYVGSYAALASDVGTATKAICEAKGMTFVKASKNGRRAHCRAKAGKAVR